MKKEELSTLMSELHNDLDELKEMQSRLREKKADRDKHLEEFRNGVMRSKKEPKK